MNTPICDFVRRYADAGMLRLHMPGHKGVPLLGPEPLDITEISGADSLFEADGIIAESERNASAIFGAHTFYSTEGSSLCIRTMLALAMQSTPKRGKKPLILAARNAHKSFLSAVALLDLEVEWIRPKNSDSYLSCTVDADGLERRLRGAAEKPDALYLTSPDYLGHRADIATIAEICHRHGVLLLVDNAHGAYLKFLPSSEHPIDLGADLCCDSAHKTLPTLTGCAYLHISDNAPARLIDQVKSTMALFASTSPSYLLLQSLDALNRELAEEYPKRLAAFLKAAGPYRSALEGAGYVLCGNEPLKWTISAKHYGYTGTEMAKALEKSGIVCEFYDCDHCVLMLSPALDAEGLDRLYGALSALPRRDAIKGDAPALCHPVRVCSPREAALSPCETLPLSRCVGHVLARDTVACPPAVPIVVCGERIDEAAVRVMAYYGVQSCTVLKED